MTRGALIVSLALVAALAGASCSVDRRSTSYACERDGDCDADRFCSRGFCAERTPTPIPGPSPAGCPAGCTSCDLEERTCEIACGIGRVCDRAACPAGYACTIGCMSPGTCGEVDCSVARSCKITCLGPAACPSIRCGLGECDVACLGSGACGFLDCTVSCRCDQSCATEDSCATSLCPIAPEGVCTEDSDLGAPCDSSDSRACDRCS